MAENCTVVVDIGSSCVKAGYAGDDVPCAIFPSCFNNSSPGVECIEALGNDINSAASTAMDSAFGHPVQRGEVKDWDQMERLWHRVMDTIGVTSVDGISVLVTESPRATVADRHKWGELLFETFRVPSMCIGSSAPLSLFASGRTTGLVAECGAGLTSVVPVFEGLSLNHAIVCMEFGGQDITATLRRILAAHNVSVDTTIARMLKERMSEVSLATDVPRVGNKVEAKDMARFELPDGTEVNVEKKIFSDCAEPLFKNDFIAYPPGLTAQICESIKLCDDSLRRELSQNIVLSGGTSLLPGISERLIHDLQHKLYGDQKLRTAAGGPPEIKVIPNPKKIESGYTFQRKVAAWIGGSIIGSIENTYREIKITRQEWEENPDACIRTKGL